jgi:hypothetical protein
MHKMYTIRTKIKAKNGARKGNISMSSGGGSVQEGGGGDSVSGPKYRTLYINIYVTAPDGLVERYLPLDGCSTHVAGVEAAGTEGAGAVAAQKGHVPLPLHADPAEELVLQVLAS